MGLGWKNWIFVAGLAAASLSRPSFAGEENASLYPVDDHLVARLRSIQTSHSDDPCRFSETIRKLDIYADGRVVAVSTSQRSHCDSDHDPREDGDELARSGGSSDDSRIALSLLPVVLDDLRRVIESGTPPDAKASEGEVLEIQVAPDASGVVSELGLTQVQGVLDPNRAAWLSIWETLQKAKVK